MSAVIQKADAMLSRRQAAAYLGVKAGTLANWACLGRYSLKFYRVGRSVKYKRSDLDRFLEGRAGGESAAGGDDEHLRHLAFTMSTSPTMRPENAKHTEEG